MVYLQNRRYLPKQSPLRKQKRFPTQKSEIQEPPAKRAYSFIRDHHQAVVNASERLACRLLIALYIRYI